MVALPEFSHAPIDIHSHFNHGSQWDVKESPIHQNGIGFLKDKEKVRFINEKVEKIQKTQEVMKMSFKNDIVGYAPIVPLALKGVPQNMINCTRKPKKTKVIHLMIDIGVTGGVSTERKLTWGAELVAKIMNLEKQGFRVRIDCVRVASEEDLKGTVHVMKVPVKNENQPFDIQRMMFPLVHPAMQRRIAFDWVERLPESQYLSGHGVSIGSQNDRIKERKIRNIADTKGCYFICCLDDIDEALKGVA